MRVATVTAILLFVVYSSFGQQDIIEGDWIGGSSLFQNPAFIHIRFASGTGVANVQSWRVFNRPLGGVSRNASKVRFEFSSTTGTPYVADGELKGNVIEGTMRRGTQEGKFHLIRVAKASRALYDQYVGAYNFPDPKQPGQFQPALVTYGALGHLRYVNLTTGDTQGLFPVTENTFVFAGAA